ncbi:MAG TPA: hypothetical protein VGH09_08410 [Solirubrobacteraceae bacterium]|jgi:hypothetical protein
MSRATSPRSLVALLGLLLALAGGAGPLAGMARAEEPDGGASWHLEQPLPPELPNGTKSTTPIGLGRIGDIEFSAPNRGLLITAGNPPTIPAGIWAYNGVSWHELAKVCGATDGRIAWSGPDEFWTVSDGRAGQSNIENPPPLADNTLCHFANGEVAASYGSLAFLPTSYQAMHGAACLAPDDCWFGGDPLPQGQAGAFQLHWDGHSVSEKPNPQGHAVEDLRRFGDELYESVRIKSDDVLSEEESASDPSVLHLIEPNGFQPPFVSLSLGVPIYASGEFPEALDFLHLSAGESALWGAADPALPSPESPAHGELTVIRTNAGGATQIVGPTTDPEGENPFTKQPGTEGVHSPNEAVSAIAAEPPGEEEGEGTPAGESAWLGLTSGPNTAQEPAAPALVSRLSSGGVVSQREQLPTGAEEAAGVGPKGAADKLTCPAPHDCWLATRQGWLFHLTTPAGRSAELANPDTDPAFNGPQPITFRPEDEGVPAVVPDAPPVDNSGLPGEAPARTVPLVEVPTPEPELRTPVPLLSNIRTRLIHGTTLELRFRLAARARVKLLAKRGARVVASTPMKTFAAGNRSLTLRLDKRRWPTKLALQTHALAPVPTVSTRGASSTTVSTGFATLNRTPLLSGPGPLG